MLFIKSNGHPGTQAELAKSAGESVMSTVERYRFDKRTQEIMEHMAIPFAVYQFIDKRVATIALSAGFCRLFGYSDLAGAYYDMDHDMYKAVHPDDAARIADAALRFAMEGGRYEVV
jgi:hypothetical protein